LRKDIAPAGHLENAAKFIIDQVPLGTALSWPEEHLGCKGLLEIIHHRCERPRSAGIALLAQLTLDGFSHKPFRLVSMLGTGTERDRIRRFYYLFKAEPGVGFNAAVKEFPVDLLDAFLPALGALGQHAPQHLLGKGLGLDAERLGGPGEQPLPPRLLEREG